jgi:NADPH:quinone reductase-like Zn-dependent oxidoreductase
MLLCLAMTPPNAKGYIWAATPLVKCRRIALSAYKGSFASMHLSAMHSMRAVVVGDKRALIDQQRRIPIPRDDQVLVRPIAIALNPTDWRSVSYGRAKPGCIVGCDYAGVVESVGTAVTKAWKPGDRIFGCAHGANLLNPDDGVFSERAAVIGDLQMRIPQSMSFEEAATLGLGSITVGQGLFQKAMKLQLPTADHDVTRRIRNKDVAVLIYGGSSATGALGIQFAKQYKPLIPLSPPCSPRP